MYVVLGYLILLAASFFGLTTAVATIPIIFFGIYSNKCFHQRLLL